jgi:hypothetical protein
MITITEHGVMSPSGVFGYDIRKYVPEHLRNFCELGGAKVVPLSENENGDDVPIGLQCGVEGGLVVIQVGVNRGDFVPKLDPGSYGVEHTALGNLLTKTKRIVDINNGTTSVIFGIVPNQWPDGIHSCTLVQPDLEGRGAINLLADGSIQPIESTPGYRFYTPFFHTPGAGSGFVGRDVYTLYPLGIMTLNREQLSELLRAFNKDWSNGAVFARKNKIGEILTDIPPKRKAGRRRKKKKEGLDRWC